MPEISVRVVRPEDAGAISALYAPFVAHTVISLEVDPPDAATMAGRIAGILPAYPWLVAENAGRIVGYVHAGPHAARAGYRWSADVTAYLADGYRGRGLGKRLYGMLFPLLKTLGYRSLYGGITLPNEASVGLHRAMGMADVGIYRNVGFKFGSWRDVLWMGLSFPDDAPPLGPPMPFSVLPPGAIIEVLRR